MVLQVTGVCVCIRERLRVSVRGRETAFVEEWWSKPSTYSASDLFLSLALFLSVSSSCLKSPTCRGVVWISINIKHWGSTVGFVQMFVSQLRLTKDSLFKHSTAAYSVSSYFRFWWFLLLNIFMNTWHAHSVHVYINCWFSIDWFCFLWDFSEQAAQAFSGHVVPWWKFSILQLCHTLYIYVFGQYVCYL